jgi:parvulin-like peptidyl-prolyl isomerase
LAKKQKKSEIKRTPTKRQLSKWQRQKKIQRIIIISGSVFFAIILSIVGYGYYQEQVKPYRQPVLKVNDTTFNMKYYLKIVELYTKDLTKDQGMAMAEIALGIVMQNELVNEHAPELGVTVDKSEIDEALTEMDLPTIKPYRDAYRAELYTNKLLASYFDEKVPATADQVNVQAMVVSTKSEAEEMIERLKAGESFNALAEEYSIEQTTKENGGDLGWIAEGQIEETYPSLSDSFIDAIAFSLDPGEISEPKYDATQSKDGGYWILEVMEKDEDVSRRVRGILLGSEQEANEVREKLLNGEDFASLASTLSQDTQSKDFGGDLGWVQKGFGNETIADAAFSLDTGDISEPIYDESITTTGGYWIVKTLERDTERPIDSAIRDKLKQDLFTAWLENLRETNDIEQTLSEEQFLWVIDQVF